MTTDIVALRSAMLKLSAEDASDLEVISAAMQDALVRVADIKYLKKQHQFALVANRFAWEAEATQERRRTGLHCNQVLSVRQTGLGEVEPDTILSLLSISFEPDDAPSGTLLLTFSAGFTIRLGVEYLDLHLRDLGPAWGASSTPSHET
jgi:Protein of unknown function (DUF2948)